MMKTSGNKDPRVIVGIKHVITLGRMGHTESAVQELSALVKEFPDAASLHGYLALYLSDLGRLDEAIEHGRHAVRLSPKSEKASHVLFQALTKAQRYLEALDEVKRYLALKPSEEYSRMIEEWKLRDEESPEPKPR